MAALALVVALVAAEPISLAQAIEAAQRDGFAARRAEIARDAALEQADLTRPRPRPDVSFRASGELAAPRVRDPAAPNAVVRQGASGRLELSAEQVVYHAGARALDDRSDAAVRLAEAEHDLALAGIARAVVTAWFDCLTAQAGAEVAVEGLARAVSQQQRVAELLALEKVAEVDKLRSDGGVLEAEAALAQAERGVRLASANLNRLLGQPLDSAVDLAAPVGPPRSLPALRAALEHAMAERPEAARLEAGIDQAGAAADFARSQGAPTLTLHGAAAAQSTTAFRESTDLVVGLRLDWPLSRADNRAQRDAAQAEAAAADANIARDELRAGIELELRQAIADRQASSLRTELALQRADVAVRAHQIALLQYDLGRITFTDVQGALVERRQAESELAIARYDVHRATALFALAAAWPQEEWPDAPQD